MKAIITMAFIISVMMLILFNFINVLGKK